MPPKLSGFPQVLRRDPLPAAAAAGLLSSCPLPSGLLMVRCCGPSPPLLLMHRDPVSTQPSISSCRAAPACPRSLWILPCALGPHLDLRAVSSPRTCLTIMGLCPTLVVLLTLSPDLGLRNGSPPRLQTCHITMNFLVGFGLSLACTALWLGWWG